ncbi:SRPBCC domain-containing protein [Sphingomonas sp. LB-2]|uniref:SRPBCC family protein n=1 Tax=Sphingomonas caeni TaxID=2984949 RepID=UPI00222F57F5|nr:SRPBCC domain-containing protein [Sphingomonas caeni]MCW3847322.1 SRPBCC domain-containing protein [Sphingomonas caeni]
MSETQTVTIEREFPHPPSRIWRALTQPHLIQEWLMRNDFVAVVGHRFNLNGDWGGTLDCEVLEVEPERSLSYRWDHAHADPAYDLKSVVSFTLEPTAGGTLLRMEQEGFRPEQKAASGGARYGWQQFFGKLETLLATLD